MPIRIDEIRGSDLSRNPTANPVGISRSRERAAAGLGQSIQNFGRAIDQEAGRKLQILEKERREKEIELERQKRAQDAVTMAGILSTFELETTEDFSDNSQNYDGRGDFTQGFSDRLTARRDKALSDIEDPELKSRLEARLTEVTTRHTVRAIDLETRLRNQHTLNALNETIDIQANAVRSGGLSIEKAIEDLPLMLEGLPAGSRDRVAKLHTNTLLDSHIEYSLDKNVSGFLSDLKGGTYDKIMDPAVKNRAMNAAQSEIDARDREAKRLAKERERERKLAAAERRAIARVEMAGLMDDNLASIAATGQRVEGVTDQAVRDIMTPTQYARYKEKERMAEAGFGVNQSLANATLSEMPAIVEALRPKAGDAISREFRR